MASLGNTIFKAVTGIHVFLYRKSGGKIWGRMVGLPILLLTTTGRKTGLERTNPVVYVRDGNDYLLSASAGGADKNPAWFANLESKPDAKIEVDGKTIPVKVVITTGDERTGLYEQFKSASNNFVEYEKKTTRKIPVIRLQPTSA